MEARRRMQQQPERLTMEQYMPMNASIQVFSGRHGGSTGLHWHEFYEITYIVSGEGRNDWNGQSYPVGPCSVFLLTPADFHSLSPLSGDSLELVNVIFSENMLDDELRFLLFSDSPHLGYRYAPDDGVAADFAAIWSEATGDMPGKRKMLKNLLERILLKHARACRGTMTHDVGKASHVFPVPIRRSLLYMEHHFRENLMLEAVAKEAALAPNYFSGLFKETVGISFRGYLQDLRIRFAKSLLLVSKSSVTEICYASGFNTLAHFERVFRDKTGMSPIAFRNNHS